MCLSGLYLVAVLHSGIFIVNVVALNYVYVFFRKMGRSQRLNEFEILQRVIEYIQMLEEALGIIVNTERAVDPGGKESLLKSFGDIL